MIQQVQQEQLEWPVRRLCNLLNVNRAWYYAKGQQDDAVDPDVAMRDAIEHLILDFPGYGYRRVTKALHRNGWQVNHKRVLRIMQEESLLCQLKRQFVPTTHSNHGFCTYPNLLQGLALENLDCAWIGDITYIRLPTCFAYLAALLDAFSRRCIGWHLSLDIDTTLTLAALEMALDSRSVAKGVIHHSDRGVQYASSAYVARLTEAGMRPSMSAKGNPYDNAKAERFFRTLKEEEVYLKQYQTFQEAKANLATFIQDVYNAKRLHSSLGYLPPVEFEAQHRQAAANIT